MKKSVKRGSRKPASRNGSVNPVQAVAAPAVAGRMEIELPLLPVDVAPRDRDGYPIVPTAWVRAEVTSPTFPGRTFEFTGEVIRVVRVEGGRDNGRVLVYVRTEDGGRWGRVAPIEAVRVRRKPASAKSDEMRRLQD